MNDAAIASPNVVSGGFGTLNIRGISGAGSSFGGTIFYDGIRSRVSTSVDGITEAYTGYNFTGAGLWDDQQLEVLRGPQSTLSGSNSIAGAVITHTNDPSNDFECALRLRAER